MIVCKHSITPTGAHPGDVIWSLGYLKSLGESVVMQLNVMNNQHVFDMSMYNNVSAIIDKQPYINKVERYVDGSEVDINLDTCNRQALDICLYDAYHNISKRVSNHDDQWLCDGVKVSLNDRDKIIYRNTRYQNSNFDWSYYIKNNINISECCFVGAKHEYISFLIKSKIKPRQLPWLRTASMCELYDVIYSCSHFYGNGGLPAVIAHGLQKPMTFENAVPRGRFQKNNHNIMIRDDAEYYLSYNKDNISKVLMKT